MQPWDKSRVHLKVAEGTSDYINASPIALHDPRTGVETTYIATQVLQSFPFLFRGSNVGTLKGPKKNVLSHFWQMVWHETGDVAVIVMLTPTEESGREKCYQYFPLDAESSPLKFQSSGCEDDAYDGEISYVETTTVTGANTVARKLDLTFGSETKTVWHLLFTAFPDFGVPEDDDRTELLALVKLSVEKNSGPSNPRIIHCSAGVGRSGTFIALEFLLAQLESGAVEEAEESGDIVQDVVHRLREQRMMMVQMENQFQFLYDVLLEELKKKLHIATSVPGPPSPKLRRLASGVGMSDAEDPAIKESEAALRDESTELAGDAGKVREVKEASGQDSLSNSETRREEV